MKLSTIELLRDLDIKGKLFFQNNYIILNGKSFPFFFLKYMKNLLQDQYSISKWVNCENDSNLVFDIQTNIYDYQENQTMLTLYSKKGFIYDLREKSDYVFLKKIILELENKKDVFYIFFSYQIYEGLIKFYKYYSIDDILDYEKKIILINFLKKNSSDFFWQRISFFLNQYYYIFEKYIYLEYLFLLFAYIPNIKKNILSEFLVIFKEDNINLIHCQSIFDLSTYFFQKKTISFFTLWKVLFNNYSIEFWYYFWQEQIWFAQLALLNKENLNDIFFYNKVNRWFLKTGIFQYNIDSLIDASISLYIKDSLYKKLQTNSILDLNSFFYIWFSNNSK